MTTLMISCFSFCNIHAQTGYCKKVIGHVVTNFLSSNITKYYYNRSKIDRVITQTKRVNFFETQCRLDIDQSIEE